MNITIQIVSACRAQFHRASWSLDLSCMYTMEANLAVKEVCVNAEPYIVMSNKAFTLLSCFTAKNTFLRSTRQYLCKESLLITSNFELTHVHAA